ncbi:hypothetical protein [Delftia tsuruhatensis]|uniref:hypothetical protein n=1 Tax=Delftia tsuruhatensis TaxID=180282 RepID=UPI00370A94FA
MSQTQMDEVEKLAAVVHGMPPGDEKTLHIEAEFRDRESSIALKNALENYLSEKNIRFKSIEIEGAHDHFRVET